LTALLRQYEPVGVMHFAAFADVSASMADPAQYYVNNVSYTLGLLATMMAAKVRVLVFSSTCATYGAPDVVPIGEACPQVPVNPYGRSKLMIEQILADYRAAYGFRTAVLRYFNAAGSDPDTEIGEDHEPETHLIPLAVRAALFGAPRLQVFGSDYPTRDGTAVRDYIHVSDLAVAHVKALQRLQAGGDSMVFNLGTGRGYSVREVIDTVQRVTGRNVPFDVVARRQGDPAELVSDCARWRDAFPISHSGIPT
jgi:UDP-glucose-4-epimerase GalE